MNAGPWTTQNLVDVALMASAPSLVKVQVVTTAGTFTGFLRGATAEDGALVLIGTTEPAEQRGHPVMDVVSDLRKRLAEAEEAAMGYAEQAATRELQVQRLQDQVEHLSEQLNTIKEGNT